MKLLRQIIGRSAGLILLLTVFLSLAQTAAASIVFKNEFLIEDNGSNAFILDSQNDVSGNITLQFGGSLAKTITYDTSNTWFQINDDVNFDSNQMLAARLENATGANSLPGGAGGLGVGGRGRIVQLTGTDTIAPGCTLSPNCGGGTYVWDGGTWISLTGTTSSNFNKLVTVGSTGSDYTTIANAAAYLQTLSGGIILLSAETHNVTTAVNMTNLIMIGKDASRTTVNITGAGQMDSYDTTYEYMTIKTGAITDDMAIDVQAGSNALLFNYVDINIQDVGDSLIDSNAGTAPTSTMKFIKSNMAGGSGTILKTKALSNLNVTSAIYIDSRSSDTPLQLSDWDLTLAGGGSVNTSGIISPIPADSIIVSPNMNLQGAIDSLEAAGNGGLITLLPGTYNISTPLTIEDDAIQMVGYGDSSIINASGFTGGGTVAAIEVGLTNGTDPVNDAVLRDFKLQVSGTGASDIHGIRVTGGEDNIVDNVTVQKISGQSGSGVGGRMGIQMIDAAAGCAGTCVLTRPVVINTRVLGDSASTSYFTDGIHLTSDSSYAGVSGNDQGIVNALADGNNVDYVAETAYVFVGANSSSLYNNRASRMGASGTGAYGIFMGNVRDTNMTANVFSGSLSTTAVAIGIDPFNTGTLKQTQDSIFNNNIIDGTSNGGVGFLTGFQVGNATNVEVSRNTFQNNTIKGAATGTATAFTIDGNADDNTISDNDIYGDTNGWDTGVNLGSALQERNLVSLNRYTNTTTLISDSGTATKIGISQHRSASSPTVNDDAGDGYVLGMVWVNTTTDTAYILTDETVGAAVWSQVGSSGSVPDFEGVYSTDADKILDTSNGAFTINVGTNTFDLTGATNINASNNAATNIGTGTTTSAVSIGGGSNQFIINSSTWDISGAGVASGLTGITSTGILNFSAASRLAMAQGAANPGTCTEGDLFYNTTDNFTYTCTDTATNTWTAVQPDTGTFTDTTPGTIADNNTGEIFNDTTRPNITTNSTSSTVLVTYMVRGTAVDNDRESNAFVIARDNGGGNPTCGTDPNVGQAIVGNSTDAGTVWSASGTFLDSPGVAGQIRYTVCNSTITTSGGDVDATANVVSISLVELGN